MRADRSLWVTHNVLPLTATGKILKLELARPRPPRPA